MKNICSLCKNLNTIEETTETGYKRKLYFCSYDKKFVKRYMKCLNGKFEKNQDMNDREQTMRKALFFTNMAYLLVDIANTAIMQSDDELRKIESFVKDDQKKKFAYAKNQVRKAKEITQKIAKPVYKISDSDNACEDSDYLYEVLKLVIDRTGETPESKQLMLEHLKLKPSIMNIYELVKQDL